MSEIWALYGTYWPRVISVHFFQKGLVTFGTVELDAGLGELVQGLGQVQGLHTAQLGTHSFHSLYSSTMLKVSQQD